MNLYLTTLCIVGALAWLALLEITEFNGISIGVGLLAALSFISSMEERPH